ncbi:MAG: ornithine cyclodeaminase family protein [Candidatus Aminicenantes bacterium]|nr:ornithine cyclodeaminase family protein [Candidatus Aminicenantes bacterium]MBL7082327.1 ornithine cyclodeaminase family protein [Candidatus Aminicenantes bacterium]
MTKIFNLSQIKEALKNIDPIQAIEKGFIAYSQGKVVVPPVGEMIFKHPPGDVHIKYGYIIGDEYYVIKIASGFYENIKSNLLTSSGLMLVFKQKTGEVACILLDEGYLTNVRTAAAGAVVAKYLAPKVVHKIGIIGAGAQGRMQLESLKSIINCNDVFVWGINRQELDAYKEEMEPQGYNIQTTLEAENIAAACNLIVMATPSKSPLLMADKIREGTHITAMGSDTPEKNELDPEILQKADIVVADSISQCLSRGEIFQAIKAVKIKKENLVELGNVIIDKKLQRSSDEQITIADLTGVAVQDIQIAKAVYEALLGKKI